MAERQQVKILAAVAVASLAVVLVQATPLAFLPPEAKGFMQGFAFAICFALAVLWLSRRYGAVKK